MLGVRVKTINSTMIRFSDFSFRGSKLNNIVKIWFIWLLAFPKFTEVKVVYI